MLLVFPKSFVKAIARFESDYDFPSHSNKVEW